MEGVRPETVPVDRLLGAAADDAMPTQEQELPDESAESAESEDAVGGAVDGQEEADGVPDTGHNADDAKARLESEPHTNSEGSASAAAPDSRRELRAMISSLRVSNGANSSSAGHLNRATRKGELRCARAKLQQLQREAKLMRKRGCPQSSVARDAVAAAAVPLRSPGSVVVL